MYQRSIVFEHYRHIGHRFKMQDVNADQPSFKLNLDAGNGGVITLLGSNNVGKSSVLLGIEKLRFFAHPSQEALNKEDCCDYFEHHELPKISLEYKLETAKLTMPSSFDGFKGKTFGMIFTPGALEACMRYCDSDDEDDCKQYFEDMLRSELYVLHAVSQNNTNREEIRIIAKEYNFVFLCAVDGPNECEESLLCFHISKIDWDKIHEGRAIKFEGRIKIHFDFNPQKDCDVSKPLRSYLKYEFEKSRGFHFRKLDTKANKEYSLIRISLFLDNNHQTSYRVTQKNLLQNDSEMTLSDSQVKDYEEKLGFPLIPKNILLYQEQEFKDDCLSVKIDDVKDSKFFHIFFEMCGQNVAGILEAYKKGEAYVERLQDILNLRLKETLNKSFNKFYSSDTVYSFRIRLSDSKVSVSVRKNNEVIELAKQSTGFKKFFNFFFNFLYQKEITQGDMILIDEAETHLDIRAQAEFVAFLRDFGNKHGILFIITTHSPFMIDLAHLDSLRLIVPYGEENRYVGFINNFSVIPSTEADTLKRIREALGGFALKNQKIIFVEGITDYNYLHAFNEWYDYGEQKLTFLPVGGLGEFEKGSDTLSEFQREKAERIIVFAKSLKEYNAIVLVDGDEAGKRFKEGVKQDARLSSYLRVVSLDEVKELGHLKDPTIESLFSKEDDEKFYISLSKELKESSIISSHFKNTPHLKEQVFVTTKGNFKNLITYLCEVAQVEKYP